MTLDREKTKLVKELTSRFPVKTGRRAAVEGDIVSTVEERQRYAVGEEYRFEAKIGARFTTLTESPHPEGVEFLYKKLLRAVTEQVYGEVRAEVYGMVRLIEDMRYEPRHELQRRLQEAVDKLLYMTEP